MSGYPFLWADLGLLTNNYLCRECHGAGRAGSIPSIERRQLYYRRKEGLSKVKACLYTRKQRQLPLAALTANRIVNVVISECTPKRRVTALL